jgi:hypothetical protein
VLCANPLALRQLKHPESADLLFYFFHKYLLDAESPLDMDHTMMPKNRE